ncbi:uncharacterized protein LOC132785016 [Drosophila nasuta]|uniref:uncharacterized protein LOC132785016 n=1 Tax=Drosophila nasuta TaxID=42062 RepID=UPI00295EC294|nr:uncharacterized protein LOC132785016 [Drosophila nasuta]
MRKKVNTSIQVNRISFSESVFSARVNWNCDTDEKSTAKVLIWHCRNGRESDYTLTPYQIPNQSLKTFVDTYYHDMLYLNVANCSNLPPYVDLSDLKKEYIFDNCPLTGDGFPYYLPMGYYKFYQEIKAEVTLTISFLIKVTPTKSLG